MTEFEDPRVKRLVVAARNMEAAAAGRGKYNVPLERWAKNLTILNGRLRAALEDIPGYGAESWEDGNNTSP